jgi:hypothetical protein
MIRKENKFLFISDICIPKYKTNAAPQAKALSKNIHPVAAKGGDSAERAVPLSAAASARRWRAAGGMRRQPHYQTSTKWSAFHFITVGKPNFRRN